MRAENMPRGFDREVVSAVWAVTSYFV